MSGTFEIELKFALRPQDLDALRSIAGGMDMGAMDADAVSASDLDTTYFDTSDQRLRRAGLSLRVRHVGGRFEQTAKAEADTRGGLAVRREISVDLESPEPDLSAFPDGALAKAVAEAVGEDPLQPVFTVAVHRVARRLVLGEGDEIELAIDEGEILAGDRRLPIAEAELELKRGDVRALFPAARTLLAGVPVRFSAEPKSGRGYRLLDGGGEAAPARALPIEIDRDATVEEALQAALRSCLIQIAANILAVEASEDPEGPHQLRIGLRRLRSALKLYKPVIDAAAGARIDDEARWLGRGVGHLRDLDVLADEIVGSCAGRVETSELNRILREKRTRTRDDLLADLAGERVSAFLMDLAAFTEGRGWLSSSDLDQSAGLAASAEDFVRDAIRRRWTKTARKGRNPDELSASERHEVRKQMKALRYSLEFASPFLGRGELKKALRDVKSAQQVLGYLNDVENAEALAVIVDEYRSGIDDPRQASAIDRAAGFCLGWHKAEAARLWAEAKDVTALRDRSFRP